MLPRMHFIPAAFTLEVRLPRVTTAAGNELTVHNLDATKIVEFRVIATDLYPQPAARLLD